MRRREFLTSLTAGAVGAALPLTGRGQMAPCPPGMVQIPGGMSVTTACPNAVSPSWYTAAAHGQWMTLPNSALASAGVMESGWQYAQVAWSGGVLNTTGLYIGATFISGTFLVVWGGGHVDSALNAIYCYGPLESASPQWYLPRPSTSPPPQNEEFDSSGNPVARHVYASLAYLPKQNWMLAAGTHYRYIDSGGGPDTPTYQFNTASPATNQPWTQMAPTNSVSGGGASTVAVYDSVNNGVWAIGGYNVMFYNPSNNTWAASAGGMTFNMANAATALDTKRGIWAVFGYDGGQYLYFYRTNNGVNNSGYSPATTGTPPSTSTSANGSIIYDPVADCFVCWYNSGATLWTLTAPSSNPYQGGSAWTWSTITPSGGAAPTAESGLITADGEPGYTTGTYGRFAYVPNPIVRSYILMNRTQDPIFLYKP